MASVDVDRTASPSPMKIFWLRGTGDMFALEVDDFGEFGSVRDDFGEVRPDSNSRKDMGRLWRGSIRFKDGDRK